MATYAIGDVQGCFLTLTRLLERFRFDSRADRIWLVGDLVNRGPRSLDVLRWAISLGDRVTAVLGNHDLHLLAVAVGARMQRPRDTLSAVLEAPDREDLLGWLSRRPLVHREGPFVLVHAGLLPSWSAHQARSLALEVENELAGQGQGRFLQALYSGGGDSVLWDDTLTGISRLRVITGALTRLRTCTREGRICLDFTGPPDAAPSGCIPWFDVPGRKTAASTVVCGHWAALGLHLRNGLFALDSGCVWGGVLTGVRLEDREVFQEPMADGS
jgi:bis(5'-nucleosyl)-tetraphosphatase (symmetrical)